MNSLAKSLERGVGVRYRRTDPKIAEDMNRLRRSKPRIAEEIDGCEIEVKNKQANFLLIICSYQIFRCHTYLSFNSIRNTTIIKNGISRQFT